MKKYILLATLLFFAFCRGNENKDSDVSAGHEAPVSLEESQHSLHALDTEVPERGDSPLLSSQKKREEPSSEKEHSHLSGDAAEEGHFHEELHLSLEKQKEWGIRIGHVTKQKVSSQLLLPGVLTLNQNKTAHISSYVAGKVVSLSADLGTKVEKGRVLLTINSPEFAQAQADFLEARAKLNLSQKEYERAKVLLKDKAIEEKEYIRRKAEHEKLATEYGVRESLLHSCGLTHDQIDELLRRSDLSEDIENLCELADPNLPILSPVKGKIIFRDVVAGEHVEPDKILLTASDLSTIWAILDAYEKDLPEIHKKSEVRIQSALYPGKQFRGRIAYISDLIDEKLRTVKIRVEVDNREGLLKPHMFITGILENSFGEERVLVPEEAVQNLNGEKIVFVFEDDGAFSVRHVELGKKTSGMRVIARGLDPGEKVVIEGAFYLKAEITKETFGHGHVH